MFGELNYFKLTGTTVKFNTINKTLKIIIKLIVSKKKCMKCVYECLPLQVGVCLFNGFPEHLKVTPHYKAVKKRMEKLLVANVFFSVD